MYTIQIFDRKTLVKLREIPYIGMTTFLKILNIKDSDNLVFNLILTK